GDSVGALPRLREPGPDDDRRLAEPELARREPTAVTREDDAVVVDDDWIREAELRNRARDHLDLVGRMGPRVARIGLNLLEENLADRARRPTLAHGASTRARASSATRTPAASSRRSRYMPGAVARQLEMERRSSSFGIGAIPA